MDKISRAGKAAIETVKGQVGLDKILRAALAAIQTVKGQVFPVVADETANGAYIVYKQIKSTPLICLDGDTGCSTVVYDVSCIADKYGTCQEVLAEAVTACLSCEGKSLDNVEVQTVNIIDQSPQEWVQSLGAYVSTLTISCFIYR